MEIWEIIWIFGKKLEKLKIETENLIDDWINKRKNYHAILLKAANFQFKNIDLNSMFTKVFI